MADLTNTSCPSCGAPQPERFCARCGEKRITTHDYSIVHFAEHALEMLTHFDFRSIRALKRLVTEPGELTRSYLSGRRRAVLGPIQLFVILNLVFAFSGMNSFSTPLFIQMGDGPFRALKRGMAADAIAHSGLSGEAFARTFDQNAGTQGKSWVFAMIPAMSLCLAVLYGFRRYFFEHLIFATHFYAFMLLLTMVLIKPAGWIVEYAHLNVKWQVLDFRVSMVILSGLTIYLYLAMRRAHGDSRVAAGARALTLGFLIYPILLAYRFLLFFVTLYTMH